MSIQHPPQHPPQHPLQQTPGPQPARRAHLLSCVLLCLAGLVAAAMAWRMGLWVDGSPGAGLLPFVSGCLLAVLSLGSLGGAVSAPEAAPDRVRPRWYLAAIGVLCALPGVVGSTLAFALALFLMIHLGERRALRSSIGWSLGLALATVVLFRQVLGVPLPEPVMLHLVGY